MKLQDQVAIITGAAQGIGAAIAEEFAREGARLVLSDIQSVEARVEKIQQQGGTALGCPCDVTDEEQVHRLFEFGRKEYGPAGVLVSNAGTNLSYDLIADMPTEVWERTLRINLTGTMFCMREAFRQMVPERRGSVINISSNVAKRGLPHRSAYAASKWAVLGLTQTGALEVADYGIRVNAILPGMTATDLLEKDLQHHAEAEGRSAEDVRREWLAQAPIHEIFDPRAVAQVALFLASDDSRTLTGQSINASGGLIMH
jgi:NAD(P)-dependent dehydrogenase (short-subunit alcohol dehydrogenase family)